MHYMLLERLYCITVLVWWLLVKCPVKPNAAPISDCSSESFLVKACFQKVVLSSRRVAATPFYAENSFSPVFLPLKLFVQSCISVLGLSLVIFACAKCCLFLNQSCYTLETRRNFAICGPQNSYLNQMQRPAVCAVVDPCITYCWNLWFLRCLHHVLTAQSHLSMSNDQLLRIKQESKAKVPLGT